MKSYTIYAQANWDRYFARDIQRHLSSKGYQAVLKDKLAFCSRTPQAAYLLERHHCLAVKNDSSGAYYIVSHIDRSDVDHITPILREHECVGVLKCQYRQGSYGELAGKVAPFTYRVKDSVLYDSVRPTLKAVPKVDKHLYFRGKTKYGREEVLSRLNGIINGDYGSSSGGGTTRREFLADLATARVALSLPGHGNFCHRELEAFGLGVVVLQPQLRNMYFDPLIGGVHYIAIPNDQGNPKSLADELRAKYSQIKDDAELLSKIAANAMRWYDSNVPFPANMRLMEDILKVRFNYEL